MYVLDTNVVSELRRPHMAEPKVLGWAASTSPTLYFLSAVTILELELGTLRLERKDPTSGQVLRTWLDTTLLPRFAGRILPIDDRVAVCCARLHVPNTHAERDAWIAATALVHAMTVVTRNIADFATTGVQVFNPWD